MLHLFYKVSAVCGYFIIMENILYGELVGLLGTEHWPGWGDSHIKVMGGGVHSRGQNSWFCTTYMYI